MIVADLSRFMRMTVDHHVGPGLLPPRLHAVDHFVQAAVLKRQLPPESQGPFQRADELVLHGMVLAVERPPVAIFQHPGNDCRNLAGAGVRIPAIRVRLVAVKEGKTPSADGRLERLAHRRQFKALQA